MIGALQGKIIHKKITSVILMVNGVGYLVYLPQSTLNKTKLDETILFYIHSHIREDAFNLYGFKVHEELELFELLLSVSGIGPKTAILVIDHGVNKIKSAISKADTGFFTTIPRLGTKNAQKIIIELKNKLGSSSELDLLGNSGETQELISALKQFGFDRNEILETIKKLPETNLKLEEKIKSALKMLGKNNL